MIYKEGAAFVAQCLNVDVATDGATDEPDAELEFHPIGQVRLEQIHRKSA